MHNAGQRVIFGWDLGGAQVKLAVLDATGRIERIAQAPCALWEGLDRLERAITTLGGVDLSRAAHAITMTGELVDLFERRATGVQSILVDFQRLAQTSAVRVFSADGFIDVTQAIERWETVASMNWLASAQWIAGRLDEAIVIDVGSTTTDLFLVHGGRAHARAFDDAGRLASEELVYSGVVRTPLASITDRVPFRGEWSAVMAEHFATTGDLYRITGELDAVSDQAVTADGRDKSPIASMRRLARMLGTDFDAVPAQSWERLAHWWSDAQLARIRRALARQLSRGVVSERAPIVGLGAGAFLVARLARTIERPYVDFAELMGVAGDLREAARTCGPALAVAALLHRDRDRIGTDRASAP